MKSPVSVSYFQKRMRRHRKVIFIDVLFSLKGDLFRTYILQTNKKKRVCPTPGAIANKVRPERDFLILNTGVLAIKKV